MAGMTGEQATEDLLKDIERRHLILPEFQRGYVWTRDQVREFAHSLYRGYPTGSFLIWKTPNPGKIRGAEAPTSDAAYFNLILDGQQRLTSIYTLINGTPPPFYEGESLYFDLYFDLVEQVFSYWKPMTMKGNPQWVPVTSFFQEGLAKFIQLRSDGDDEAKKLYFDNLDKLNRLDSLRSYRYYVQTITEPEMERVVTIFDLVNSSGTRLSKSDLSLAYICSGWPEARGIFSQAQDRFAEHGFRFGLEFFTRATATVATGSGTYEPLYRTSVDVIKKAWNQAEKALTYLVNLLRGNAFIEGTGDLKSDWPLVTVVNYLVKQGGVFQSSREEKEVLHWLYAALMWGRYTGSSESKLNSDITALSSADPIGQLRDNLLQQRGRIQVTARDLERSGRSSPFYNMAYIVARSKGAVDWFTGQALFTKGVGPAFQIESHHIFPQSLLYKEKYSSKDHSHRQAVNEIANLSFLSKGTNIQISNKDPLKYLEEVRSRYRGALEAQFVPMDETLWTLEAYEDFVAVRRHLIADAINSFMDDLLSDPDATDTTIDDLLAQDEHKLLEFKASLRYDVEGKGIPQRVLNREVAKTLAAFLNTEGGTLLIGVRDDRSVVGIEHDFKLCSKQDIDGFQLAFVDVVNAFLGADIGPLVDLSFAEKEGKTIAVAHCEPSYRPVFLKEADKQEFFVRSAGRSQSLTTPQTVDYIKGKWPGQ